MPPRIAIIGCGAAGAFCASLLREAFPFWRITLFEAGRKPLAKVAITGGGRCNLTNSFEGISSLAQAYPRGERLMKRGLAAFGPEDTCRWFRDHGVKLVLQEDHCWFPASQDALEIVHTLLRTLSGAELRCNCRVKAVLPGNCVEQADGSRETFDAVVVTTGGAKEFPMLEPLGLEMVPPVPSLFTLETSSEVRQFAGTVLPEAGVALAGTSFRADGPLLITDWGFSGPATLRLSSYAARYLADHAYHVTLLVNWTGQDQAGIRASLSRLAAENGPKLLSSVHPVPARLWQFLLESAGFSPAARWRDIGPSALNRLTDKLANDAYPITRKGRFKEEFVTCGGVSLREINPSTMECRRHSGLYFAGEVLDIDGITGGFNLQAAWTTAWLAAQALMRRFAS